LTLASPTLAGFNVSLVNNTSNTSVDLLIAAPTVNAVWGVDSDGNWSLGSNWIGGTAPNGVDHTATFGAAILAPRIVTVDSPQTVGAMTFSNSNSYTIGGSSTLTLDVSSGQAQVQVVSGNHTIAAPLTLNKDTTFTVDNDSNVLTVSGNMNATGKTVTKAGIGIVQFENVRSDGLVLSAGTARIRARGTANDPTGTSVVKSLIFSGGQLDVANNSIVIDYTGPVGTLVSDTRNNIAAFKLQTGSGVSNVTGLGYADNAALDEVKTTFAGQTVDPSSILVKFTYFGDSDLDGDVDVADLGHLASNWQTSQPWAGGDFDYNGSVDVNDLGLLASNWQAGVGSPLGPSFAEAAAQLGLPNVSVPEPATVSLLGALGAWSLKRPGGRSRR
jgi:hypothetical protein